MEQPPSDLPPDSGDGNALDNLNNDVQRNLNIWTDIGLFSIALYVALAWGRVVWWLIKRWKLTIPILIFIGLSLIHGCSFATNKAYRNYLEKLAEEERRQRKEEYER